MGDIVEKIIRRLRVTWADDEEYQNVEEQIKSGIVFLKSIAGGDIDFENDPFAYQLLYDYVRYIRADCSELFEKNYLSSLNGLRLRYRMKRAREAAEDEAEISD